MELISFEPELKKRLLHIHRAIAVLLLMVFAMALTPFAAFHDHHHEAPVCVKNHQDCGHKFHIHEGGDNCLICKAHFEKNYAVQQVQCHYFSITRTFMPAMPPVKGSYTELISLSLRGPPLA